MTCDGGRLRLCARVDARLRAAHVVVLPSQQGGVPHGIGLGLVPPALGQTTPLQQKYVACFIFIYRYMSLEMSKSVIFYTSSNLK